MAARATERWLLPRSTRARRQAGEREEGRATVIATPVDREAGITNRIVMLHCPPDCAAVHDGARGPARLETPHRRQSWSAPRRAPVIHRPLLQALLPHTPTHLTRPPLLLQLSHLFSSLVPQPRPKHSQHTMVSSLMSLSSCEAKGKLTCRCSSQSRVKLCPSQVRLRGHASPGAAGDPCWQSSARRLRQAERTATDEPCLFPAPRRSRPLLAARRARLSSRTSAISPSRREALRQGRQQALCLRLQRDAGLADMCVPLPSPYWQ